MRPEEMRELLESVGAIRLGHFELSSGRHSGTYVQCALVLQYPRYAEMLGRALASEFHDLRVDCVASPALGGLILGQEVARALPGAAKTLPGAPAGGTRAVFVERDTTAALSLRHAFHIEPDKPFLVVEDVWTTAASTFETIPGIEQLGGRVRAVAPPL